MGNYQESVNDNNQSEEIIITNYWKEIHKEISEELKNISGIVIITHNSIEFKDILEILKKIRRENYLKILYISLTRSYDHMKLELNRNEIENKKITFVDCVTGYTFRTKQELDDCLYHDPPLNLDQMKNIINFGIKKCNPDMVIIDSLTQFINFSRPTETEISSLYKFLNSIKTNSLNAIQDTFILLYDNKLGMMQNLPKMYTDIILKIEVYKEEYNWRD